jgi:hypothetical protein
MQHTVVILMLVCCSFLQAVEESANDVAKRVIAAPIAENKLAREKEHPQGIGSRQEDFQLADAGDNSRNLIRAYMLSESVTEKVRIAYAITLVAQRRQPQPSLGQGFAVDRDMNEQFLKDGLVLISRLAEIEKAEQAGSGQPATRPESKSEGGDKPQPEAEERSR